MIACELMNEELNEKINEAINEENIKNLWQNALLKSKGREKKYTILLPPPNITGSLHMGHFLNWSIQDLLMRSAYMQNFQPNWLPGLDHAGIGAQFIVERELEKEGLKRSALGKEAFINRIWAWKETAEELVTQQALKFGFFLNWEERIFTMDEDYKQHVTNAFVRLYNDGLITKNTRLTNWDTKFQTALSDLEITEKVEKRLIYIIQYKEKDFEKTGQFINIATTRPETLFADAAICVHPDDERFKHLHGKTFLIPLIDKEIPLILDKICDMEKGTGALKVTPAHDATDNEIGKRHNLDFIQIINKAGCMFNVPQAYENKTTAQARLMIIQELKQKELLIETKPWEGIVLYAEKSDQPIETIMTEQWFLNTKELADLALKHSTQIEFLPENIRNTFKNWMDNITPWCISRQIWWGHSIPIWYTQNGQVVCAHNEEEAKELAKTDNLRQETDVLDTWFSSALWPIATQEAATQESTTGPTETKKFEPTDILVTGKDILFFWVARMIMFTLYFKKAIPFKRIYFNGIVRDKNRQKMSKTKGNTLNPITLAQEYPQDAIRFALLKQASWGKDILIDLKDIESARTLITKLVNAQKFITEFMSDQHDPNNMLDNWMASKIEQAKIDIETSINECAFHQACHQFYDLFWNNFCAWYIEGCKIFPSERAKVLFADILKIGHPILPWITQECFQALNKLDDNIAILDYEFSPLSVTHSDEFDTIINLTKILRKLAITGGCKTFMINGNQEIVTLIKGYTKLQISHELNFEFTIYGHTIFIDKECAQKAKTTIQKELEGLYIEIEQIKSRIHNAHNIPDTVLFEWQERLQSLQSHEITLKSWIENLAI